MAPTLLTRREFIQELLQISVAVPVMSEVVRSIGTTEPISGEGYLPLIQRRLNILAGRLREWKGGFVQCNGTLYDHAEKKRRSLNITMVALGAGQVDCSSGNLFTYLNDPQRAVNKFWSATAPSNQVTLTDLETNTSKPLAQEDTEYLQRVQVQPHFDGYKQDELATIGNIFYIEKWNRREGPLVQAGCFLDFEDQGGALLGQMVFDVVHNRIYFQYQDMNNELVTLELGRMGPSIRDQVSMVTSVSMGFVVADTGKRA